ncbi:P-loop ATPase, Sll1717 family [Niallia circulans]|uniref:P-loop ATPase, Sll1717 family n=1 Tax=Niallia circulans TaxID=1397 RepID=UPI00352EB41F
MSASVPLSKLYIGNIDGEQESSRDNFEQLFYTKNSKFDEIMQPEKFIISGRKGTGKTILANYIVKKTNNNKNYYSRVFKKEDFKLQKLIDLEYREFQEEERSLFWKWFFLLQIGQVLVKEKKYSNKVPFLAEKKLKKFISTKYPDDIFKLVDFNKSQSKKSTLKTAFKTKGKQLDAGAEDTTSSSKNYGQKQYYELLSQLKKLVFDCLKKKSEVVLIYDDLDEIEERVSESPNYYKLLKSMLETIKELNIEFSKLKKTSTKIIVLLRSDIIDEIHKHSSNSNKLTTEGEVKLYWIAKNYKSPADHPLMEMVLYKIQKSVPEYSGVDKNTLYKLLFPKNLYDKEIIDYLLNYSFGRPRDIIQYLNLIIKSNPEATHFEPNFFKECSQTYSKWFYNELENEISIHENKNSILEGVKLLNDIKKLNLNLQKIEDHYNQNSDDYPNITNLKQTMVQLYKFGVVGNSWRHGKTKKGKPVYHFSWGYRDDASNDPNFSQTFVVHYGLRKYFS